jgi:hypothetical protein
MHKIEFILNNVKSNDIDMSLYQKVIFHDAHLNGHHTH